MATTAGVVLVTEDAGLAAFAIATGAHLDGLTETKPRRFDFRLSQCRPDLETAYLNNEKVGARDLLSAEHAVKTALAGAYRRARS